MPAAFAVDFVAIDFVTSFYPIVDHDILLHGLVLEVAFGLTNTALVLRSPVADTVRTVRRAARVGAGSTAVRAVHRRAGTDRRATAYTSTHV